jgi:hypothetical protein
MFDGVAVIGTVQRVLRKPYRWWLAQMDKTCLATRLAAARDELLKYRMSSHFPRIAVVKQDVNEDLYCCPRNSTPREIVESTLLRSGPVCLFSEWNADFLILATADDPECSIWKERATHLKWDTPEFFSSYRDRIPGRDFGQNVYSVDPASVDWNAYDIVISFDVAVPERITRAYPGTAWCYYVREIKAPAYAASLKALAPGQDFVLNHRFRMRPERQLPHVVEFPYHLQSPGCFHRLFAFPMPDDRDRKGVFVDHHTMLGLSNDVRRELTQFGGVSSTAPTDGKMVPTSARLARRTMEPEIRSHLLEARYFLVTPGIRNVFGTAVVEAIAAGCLAVGSRRSVGCGEFFTDFTAAETPEEAIIKMRRLQGDRRLYQNQLNWQRLLVEYLCYARPVAELLDRAAKRRTSVAPKLAR